MLSSPFLFFLTTPLLVAINESWSGPPCLGSISTSGVSKGEFQNWFRKNGLALTAAQTQDLLSEFDRSGDGRLSYPEFTAFLTQASRGDGGVAAGGGGGRAAWERPDRDDREVRQALAMNDSLACSRVRCLPVVASSIGSIDQSIDRPCRSSVSLFSSSRLGPPE